MSFDPAVFGEGFHRFVEMEFDLFGTTLAPFFHIASLIVLLLVFCMGNRVRTVFTAYFALNWLFLFGYWGVFGVIYWAGIGVVYLLVFLAAPVLLAFIAFFWVRELFRKSIDLDYRQTAGYRWAVLPVLVWGFWYPFYQYGQGFTLNVSDLLFSYYGLMPCPTTMVVLSLFTLNYPRGNRVLFRLMAIYAVLIGTATVLTGWLPDIPFIVIGLYAFGLMLFERKSRPQNIGGKSFSDINGGEGN
ncbi:MAG TPA: hypothetical protein PK629_05450 [Oscillospiraceae bacterium]|nr:hypothetical protein [Oscillospiraceae bacterium]HPF55696.1 hypothetical protein [Clostridiales bacterium]HPK35727.1 hypothetical protein [Oscillospiraceae bacterium]HPR75065.1 hypothetical protein [Oscillospiraceae bacterium]